MSQILSDRAPVQPQLPRDPPPGPSLLLQGNNALLLVHFELMHRPKCSRNQNTQANASPQRWLVLTRNSLAGFARKLTPNAQSGVLVQRVWIVGGCSNVSVTPGTTIRGRHRGHSMSAYDIY